jgi:hypothetical protein
MKSIFIGDIQTMCISSKSCLEIIFFVPASFLLRFSFDWNSNNERRKNEEETKENRRAIEESVKIERISQHFGAFQSNSQHFEAIGSISHRFCGKVCFLLYLCFCNGAPLLCRKAVSVSERSKRNY